MKKKKRGKLERKVIISMAVIFLVGMIATSFVIFWGFFDDISKDLKRDLVAIAGNIRVCLVDDAELNDLVTAYDGSEIVQNDYLQLGDYIDNWLENGADDHYNVSNDRLANMAELLSLNDVFVYKAAKDESGKLVNDMTIVFDTPMVSSLKNYQLGDHFGKSQAFEAIKKVYETGMIQPYDHVGYNSSGLVFVAFAPIKYSDGSVSAVIGVESSVNNIINKVMNDYSFLLIDAAVNFLVFGLAVFIFIKISIVKPVGIISDHMNKFVSDESSLSFTPVTEIHTSDEIQQIADDFNSLAQRTIDYTKNLAAKTSKEERLRVDYDVASQMRKVISSEMSYPAFPERTDFDLCASLNHTKFNKCSFCNYFFTDTNRLVIVVGESLGDSLASMIFSVLSVSYIKCFAIMGFDPYKIASETNNQLCSIEKKDAGLTVGAFIADIDLKNGVMRYVNAGMPPMLIKKPGENFELAKADLPFNLGQMRGVSFEQNTLQLYQGSAVFLTSTGVTEMSDPKGDKYGFDRLLDVMNRITGNVYDLDKAIKELENDLDNFRNDAPVPSDTTILGFRYFG